MLAFDPARPLIGQLETGLDAIVESGLSAVRRASEDFMNRVPVMPVLDHGFVRLVDFMGGDLSVVRNARVSHDAAWRAGKDAGSDERLIRYLQQHGHNTPFEAVQFTFEVMAPIFVLRQWMRHRTKSFNELSARYREMKPVFFMPDPATIGTQSKVNKQARDMASMSEDEINERVVDVDAVSKCHTIGYATYKRLLQGGWPRELARTVLPLATYSHMFVTVDLHNLFRFLSERVAWDAQYEIRLYAQALLLFAGLIAPVSVEAWRDHHFRWEPTGNIAWAADGVGVKQHWRQPATGKTEWRDIEPHPHSIIEKTSR